MKKITLLMLFLSTVWGYSQVKRYTFSGSAGTYSEISDGTVLGDETNDAQRFVDPTIPVGSTSVSGVSSGFTGIGLPIGFNFTYNGYVYDRFAVATDGFISLGSSVGAAGVDINVQTVNSPISSNVPANDILSAKIAGLAKDLKAQAGSSISYKTVGDVVGQRVLVVQWKKYMKGTTLGTNDNFNFQIRLNEGTNNIQVVYGPMVSNAQATAQTFAVGLRASSLATNFVNRTSTTGWDNTVNGVANTDKVLMSDLVFPSNGLTFTWAPPTCGGAIAAVASAITTSGATLNLTAYTPVPDSYEYIVSTSATMPLSTDSGTATTAATVALTNLNPTTVYNIFLRTKCGSEFTPWILGGTLKTLCLDALTFYEDFDSYTAGTLPDCWSKVIVGGGDASTSGSTVAPMSAPNRLYVKGNSGTDIGYVIMPVVSNLSAGTNRLRFKAYGSAQGTFDVGYFDGINNTGTFHSIQANLLTATTMATAQDIIVPSVTITAPGVKNLVFRSNGTATTFLTVNIDNVVWEPTPGCADVTAPAGKGITGSSINLTWTKGGSETQWQYVCGAGLQNPNTATPVDVSSNAITVTGLSASTNYKIWVRSKCSDTQLGAWIGPVVFSTVCAPVAQFMENFDSSTSLPSCWAKSGTTGTVTVTANALNPTQPNMLVVTSTSATNVGMVSLPPMSNYGTGSNRLRFKMRVSVANSQIDIGYLTDSSDPSSYVFLQTVTSSNTASFDIVSPQFLGSAPKSPYLVFRNPGLVSSSVYLDDVAWEPNPACPDITGFALSTVRGTSADLTWTAGGNENAWQYAVGGLTTTSPYSLNAVDVAPSSAPLSLTIGGLTPVTYYKVWMRSKCTGGIYGAWMGPVTFTTTCASGTDFTQNFDVTQTTMPACWTKVGINGSISPASITGAPSGSYALSLGTSSTAPAICSMPPVSNAGAGTYTLKFSYKSSVVNGLLEVGFLLNPADPSSFSPLASYSATQTTSFVPVSVELGTDATTDVLAFRNAGVPSCTIYIDDVSWSATPTCTDVKNLVATGVAGTSVSIDWDAGGSETNWQYAIGSASLADATTLKPVDVATTSAVTINGLTPVASYKIWVRSKCSKYSLGTWIGPALITTTCEAVDSFLQNFDASTLMPPCWKDVNGKGAFPTALADAPSGSNALYLNGPNQPIASMPPLSNAGAADHILKFKYRANNPANNNAGCVLEVGYLANPTDANSFVSFTSIPVDNIDIWKSKVLSLGNSPVSNTLAFRSTGPFRTFLYVDDVSWDVAPKAVPDCATGVKAVPNANCGKLGTVVSWDAVSGADGYFIDVRLTPDGPFVVTNQDAGAELSYSFEGNKNTTYYYTVKPYNYKGVATGCNQLSFVTNATDCYCISVPKNNDFEGITNVQLGTTNFTNPDVTYNDFTSKPINIALGGNTNLKISFGEQIDYNTAVWIDFNNDFYFDESELVSGVPSGGATPSLVDASFTMPTTAALGTHRMRIVTWSGVFSSYSPCYNFPYGVTLDFNVNVVVPVTNDEPAGAVTLIVGGDFASNAVTATNVASTASIAVFDPGCGNYNGNDVWYSAIVPALGNLTFEMNSISGGMINTGAAAYMGVIGSLVFMSCDDSSGNTGLEVDSAHPKISLTGRKAGEVIYFRVWEKGGDAFVTFKVSAYDATASILGTNTFDDINFSYYPNPVKDMLNLSFNQEISNVSIVNLLGQQVISKYLNASQGKIDMSALSKGAYLVKVTIDNQSKAIKILKE